MERCPFCGGIYVLKLHGIRCLMCDRSTDIDYERYVMDEKRREHGRIGIIIKKEREEYE